jgi:transposase
VATISIAGRAINTKKVARHRWMKRATVALARRLAVIMHRIWVDGTEFRWTREQAAVAA